MNHRAAFFLKSLLVVVTIVFFLGFVANNKATIETADSEVNQERAPLIDSQPLAEDAETRIVTKQHTWPNEPIEIVNIRIKGKLLELNPRNKTTKLKGDDDWLRGFSVKLKNTSNKPIIYLDINVWFTEPKTPEPILVYSLTYGDPPLPKNAKKTIPLMPGEETELSISDKSYEQVKFQLESTAKPSITTAKKAGIVIQSAYFNDDTGWSTGVMLRRDPDDPRKWNRSQY